MTEYVATRWYRAPEVMLCEPFPAGQDELNVSVPRILQSYRYLVRWVYSS